MTDFLFDVGDLVVFKTSVADCRHLAEVGERSLPNHWLVVERNMTENSRGKEVSYWLSSEGKELRRAAEVELMAVEDFDVREHGERVRKMEREVERETSLNLPSPGDDGEDD